MDQGVHTLDVVEAVLRSAATGRVVDL